MFTDEYHEAFCQTKHTLIFAPIIQLGDCSLRFEIICDVMDHVVGALLGQRKDKKPCMIYYDSRTLDVDQQNYTTTEKKMLAIMYTMEKF